MLSVRFGSSSLGLASLVGSASAIALSLVACRGVVGELEGNPRPRDRPGITSGQSAGAAGGASDAGGGPGQQAGGTGSSQGKGGTGGTAASDLADELVQPRLPRLSHTQWARTAQAFLRLKEPPKVALRPDSSVDGAYETDNRTRIVDGTLAKDYRVASGALADQVLDDPSTFSTFVEEGGTGDAETRLRTLVAAAFPRAYRRALSPTEVARYVSLGKKAAGYTTAPDDDQRLRAALRPLLRIALQSPHFVYRVELGDEKTQRKIGARTIRDLTNDEYAARLSYAVLDAPPDAALRSLDLRDATVRASAVGTLVADPRAAVALLAFHQALYLVTPSRSMRKDATVFPGSDGLGIDAATEASLFLDDVTKTGGGVRDLLLSRRAFVNKRLGSLYGLSPDGLTDGAFDQRELKAERGGVLTRISFLGQEADLVERSTILRGVYVQRKVLCGVLDDPPTGAIQSAPAPPAGLLTNRERVGYVTGAPLCSGCHEKIINPLGFTLERFDAIGRFVTTEKGVNVDATATIILEGKKRDLSGARELLEAVAEAPSAHRCYVENLAIWMLGRPLSPVDRAATALTGKRSQDAKLPLRALLADFLVSEAFSTLAVEAP